MTKLDALLLSDDLLFASRVTATAGAQGFTVVTLRDGATLLTRATATPPVCVILDLQVAGDRAVDLIQSLRSMANPPRIVGYGSHVDAAALAAARNAGCDIVLPRSAFTERLEKDLPIWLNCAS